MTFSKALYFTALIPPPQIREEVLQLKLDIRERFGAAHALKLPAHITINPPVWLEKNKEKEFLQALENQAKKEAPCPVELKNFDHFGQRVLFIGVVDHEPIKQIYTNLSARLASVLPTPSGSSIHPHITLATRDLNREKFPKIWKEFSTRSYNNTFEASALFLLRHNGKTWDIIEEFPFGSNEIQEK